MLGKIKKEVKNLNAVQLKELANYIYGMLSKIGIEDSLSDKSIEIVCPLCESKKCVKNGTVRGKQRFLCRDCNRTLDRL